MSDSQRAAFIAEAKTWLGTPFRDQADVKGGGVDCAMLLVRAAVDTGLVPPFDPRPYPPQWHLHRDEERFLGIVSRLGTEVRRAPIPGDVIVYLVARCFAHGGIIIEMPGSSPGTGTHVLHAYYKTGHVAISPLHEVELAYLPSGKPRPFKLFDLWAHGGGR
jgi:cell wall-associated NlpC family hydrolase